MVYNLRETKVPLKSFEDGDPTDSILFGKYKEDQEWDLPNTKLTKVPVYRNSLNQSQCGARSDFLKFSFHKPY